MSEDINIGGILESLNEKLDLDFGNAVFPIKGDGVIIESKNEDHLQFLSGTNVLDGAVLVLRGKNADYPGAFTLRACGVDGNFQDLMGFSDGTLSWRGRSIAAIGMPSSKYIDLSLGASETSYTAPANGWFAFAKTASSSGQYIQLNNTITAIRTRCIAYGNEDLLSVFMPAQKGQNVLAIYTAGGSTMTFRFIYAEGDNID